MVETLQNLLHTALSQQHTITDITPVSESRAHRVWKITTPQASFAAKHHIYAPYTRGKPYDLLQVEQIVTALLLNSGVSVPPIVTSDSDSGLVIYEWCGDQTLDDICQTAHPEPYVQSVIDSLWDAEKTFHTHTQKLAPHIAPGCSPNDLQEHWSDITKLLLETLSNTSTQITGRTLTSQHLSSWKTLLDDLAAEPPTLGLTDYNARNIICTNPETTTLLELAKIGYDWPERRLIQYTTSLGAHNPDGRIVNLITPTLAQHYANHASKLYQVPAATVLARLDAHHLIFHLLAFQRVLEVKTDPNHPWQNIDTRQEQHRAQLALELSNDLTISTLRSHFQNT